MTSHNKSRPIRTGNWQHLKISKSVMSIDYIF